MRGAAILALALAGCTQSATMDPVRTDRATRELERALAGRVAGEPVNCVNAGDLRQPRVIDGGTILYNRVGSVIWRNDLADRCPALRPTSTIVLEVRGSSICRGEPIRVIESGSSIGAVCALGSFTPYRRAPRPEG